MGAVRSEDYARFRFYQIFNIPYWQCEACGWVGVAMELTSLTVTRFNVCPVCARPVNDGLHPSFGRVLSVRQWSAWFENQRRVRAEAGVSVVPDASELSAVPDATGASEASGVSEAEGVGDD